LLALHLTFRARTDGVADGGARRIVALPFAGRVAIRFCFSSFDVNLSVGIDFNRRRGDDHNSQ
jgi:hypothetical protein